MSLPRVAIVQNAVADYNVPLFQLLQGDALLRVQVIGARWLRPYDTSTQARLPAARVGVATAGRGRAPSRWVIETLLDFEPDVTIIDGLSSFGTATVLAALPASKRGRLVWWSLGTIPGRVESWRSVVSDRVQALLLSRCHGVIGYSTHAARFFGRLGVPAERIRVAFNTLDEQDLMRKAAELAGQAARMRQELRVHDGPLALFSGTLLPHKGVDRLIRSLAGLRKELSAESVDPGLVIVGDGPELGALRELAASLSIADRVFFAGRRTDDIAPFYEMSDFVVLPGLGGLAINQAFAHGKPVVCGPADGCELDLVEDDVTGLYRAPLDDVALLAAMRDLFRDPARCGRLGEAARSRLVSQFPLVRTASQIRDAALAAMGETAPIQLSQRPDVTTS